MTRYAGVMTSRRLSTLRLVLDQDRMDAAERTALWQNAMSTAGRVYFEDPDRVAGELVTRSLGDLRTMRINATSFGLERDARMARQVRRDHVFLNLVERGRMHGWIAGRKITVSPGAVLISRLASPTDIIIEEATWLALIVPRAVFEKYMHWSRELDARVFGPETAQAVMIGGLLRSLCALPDPMPARATIQTERSSLAFVMACLGGAVQSTRVPNEGGGDDPARSIRRFIAEHLPNPELGIDLICREFALSRSRLYRIMAEGADIATTIRRLRLQAVHRDISSGRVSHLTLAEIGRRWGLTDERNFRRAFVREFGNSPSELRRNIASDALVTIANSDPISADIKHWFQGL